MEEQQPIKKNNTIMIIAIVLIAMIAWYFYTTSAQEKVAENMIESQLREQGLDGDVNIDGDEITINMNGEDGEIQFSAGSDAEVPSDFPTDIPIYSNAVVITSLNMPTGVSVQFETQDSQNKIKTFYETKMEGNDWVKISSMDGMGDMYGASYIKGESNATVAVMDHPEKEGYILFSITYSKE